MDESKLYELLVRCMPAQLDAITIKGQLDEAFLPGSGEPIAARAGAILKLFKQRGPKGLATLEKAINEVLGRKPGAGATRPASGAAKPARGLSHKAAAKRAPCILVLAANPIDTERLRLDREVKVIEQQLDKGEQGRRYTVVSKWAVTSNELQEYLLKYEPTVVHFSGHGSSSGEIMLEADDGRAKIVPPDALVTLFETLKGTEAIVLNACYSAAQAKALARVVPQVIGMSDAIGDDAALLFASGFYGGLAFGKDYETAFRLGSNAIGLGDLPDAAVPHFTTRSSDRIAVKGATPGERDGVELSNAP